MSVTGLMRGSPMMFSCPPLPSAEPRVADASAEAAQCRTIRDSSHLGDLAPLRGDDSTCICFSSSCSAWSGSLSLVMGGDGAK